MQEIKFLSLTKAELTYEVAVRGETPASTVDQLRKQISKLAHLNPSEDILLSHLEPAADVLGVSETLDKVEGYFRELSTLFDADVFARSKNLCTHIAYRIRRIDCSDSPDSLAKLREVRRRFDRLMAGFEDLAKPGVSTPADPVLDQGKPVSQVISVTCDRGSSLDLGKLKYDGKSCARAFIKRISEFMVSRSVSDAKLLSSATDIFTGDALHWFRGIRDSVSSWSDVTVRLKEDFGYHDYDYRFLAEIRARTQGDKENITIYLSIMAGMFSQLDNKLSEEEKLEIILHNIRPCYASVLASCGSISSIEELRALCRNYEIIHSRMSNFHEPPRVSTDTMAPEFAYSHITATPKPYRPPFNSGTDSRGNSQGGSNNSGFNRPYPRRSFPQGQQAQSSSSSVPAQRVGAISRNYSNYCPRCRVDSHNFYNCAADRSVLVCFGCGKQGVRIIDCPDCRGNRNAPPKN